MRDLGHLQLPDSSTSVTKEVTSGRIKSGVNNDKHFFLITRIDKVPKDGFSGPFSVAGLQPAVSVPGFQGHAHRMAGYSVSRHQVHGRTKGTDSRILPAEPCP